MSGERRLWIRFRRVESDRLEPYRKAVGALARAAGDRGAHVWAFTLDGTEGVVVEFLEGQDDGSLSDLARRAEAELALAAAGPGSSSPALTMEIPSAGLRGTEIRSD